MIKSSVVTLKFCNAGKRTSLELFRVEYTSVVRQFVDMLWDLSDVPKFLTKEYTGKIDTWLSARALQCAGKQASGIVRGAKTKQKKRLYQIEKFTREGQISKAKKLRAIYDNTLVSKPDITEIQPELDDRFVTVDLDNSTSFDGWLTLGSLGNKMKIQIPFKRHKHLNKLLSIGKLKGGVRLGSDGLTLMVSVPEPVKQTGDVLGIDVGQLSILSCSNGTQISKDKHGHSYDSICLALARKKKGSKSFGKTQRQRTNFINWSINQIDFSGYRKVNIENIKHLRKGKQTSASLRHWNYAELFDRLEQKLSDSGVQTEKISPVYTSQRCSNCGWVKQENRKEKLFLCTHCGFTDDADNNASLNISLELVPLTRDFSKLRKMHSNGFFWRPVNEEPIVPHTQKTLVEDFSSF